MMETEKIKGFSRRIPTIIGLHLNKKVIRFKKISENFKKEENEMINEAVRIIIRCHQGFLGNAIVILEQLGYNKNVSFTKRRSANSSIWIISVEKRNIKCSKEEETRINQVLHVSKNSNVIAGFEVKILKYHC